MNWYKKTIKLASVRYLYHGTSINNLQSILSEGLNTSHGTVYDETFQNTREERGSESFGGIYLTDNLRSSLMAGHTAAEKNKVEGDTSVIVVARIEDRTPTVLMDEDLLELPYHGLAGAVGGDPSIPIVLTEWIVNGYPNIENGVDSYLASLSQGRTDITDKRFLQGIRPYVYDLLKTYAIQQLAIAIKREDWGTSMLREHYPELEGTMDMGTAIQNYRNAASVFMQKANRLTIYLNDMFQNNMRITEPLSYKGKNRIVLVSTFNRNKDASEYNYSVDILYSTDDSSIQMYLNDIIDKYSNNIIMTYKNNIIYDNKKEQKVPDYELV